MPQPTPPRSIDQVLAEARAGASPVEPEALPAAIARGAHVIDVRSAVTREPEGHIPGAVVVERLVLEWRLDPQGAWRMPGGPGYDDEVVVVCNEGYHSSLAARDLRALGFHRATDLRGGFRAYAAAGLPVAAEPDRYVD
ncbi:rhodanese-like domain-containing protein [Brachybacterium horti]